jgi:hypothetical protein
MSKKKTIKRGIIQSRGIGDILIALPIARYYFDLGDEIHWPICEEFLPHFTKVVPWVHWHGVPTDAEGKFFMETPLRILKEVGCDNDEVLNLYQFLSSRPDLTDAELFNILKFDQYKYWVANVPFVNKWSLDECITRDPVREDALKAKLKLKKRYAIAHLGGSNFKAQIDVNWLDPAVQVVEINESYTDCIFDWLGVLEGAEAFIGVDSCFVNLVDSLLLDVDGKYFIRRSAWDATPVLGSAWIIVPTNLPITEAKRIDIVEATKAMAAPPERANDGQVHSHVPFKAAGSIPDNFMDALSKPVVVDPAAALHGALPL